MNKKPANMTKAELKQYKEYQEWLMSHPFQKTITLRNTEPKFGRNETCPCGSNKKYKKCCLKKGNNDE